MTADGFPGSLGDGPLPRAEVREALNLDRVGATHITDVMYISGDKYVTGLVVYTDDGDAYRATFDGESERWAVGKLIQNPDAAW